MGDEPMWLYLVFAEILEHLVAGFAGLGIDRVLAIGLGCDQFLAPGLFRSFGRFPAKRPAR